MPKKPSDRKYLKYMGMASQMIVIILLGAYLGQWLDNYFETTNAYFTAATSLFAVSIALYNVLKDFLIP